MSNQNNTGRRRLHFPHTFVLIFLIAALTAIMANIVPAGQYDRVLNEATGRTVVEPSSFHYVEKIGCSITDFFRAFPQAFQESAQIMFFIAFAYFFVRMLLKNGTFDALVGWSLRKVGHNIRLIIPVCMLLFGLMGSTIGLFEETYGMIPVFMAIAIAMGFDGVVGSSIVYIAVAIGFAAATLNPFTVGVAMPIAEVAYPTSGMGFRILCFAIFMLTGIIYVWRYASRIQADPTRSVLYGEPNSFDGMVGSKEELMAKRFNTRQIISCVIFIVTIGVLIWGTMPARGWYIDEIATLFLVSGLVTALVSGFNGNDIAQCFIDSFKEMAYGMLVVGLSRSVQVIMNNAMITDTVVHALANGLQHFTGVLSALGMLFAQNIINFFIPSGSGQAIVTMPILTPLADLVGVSRETAVLAFQFGDGFSNIFWPTSVFTMCGIMQVPINKWYRYVTPLFLILFAEQIVLIILSCFVYF